MNTKIIDKLTELKIFDSEIITDKEYKSEIQNRSSDNIKYFHANTRSSDAKWYKRVDTKGLSDDDVRMLLDIDRTQNIRAIKTMVKFFVVLAIIGIVFSVLGILSLPY